MNKKCRPDVKVEGHFLFIFIFSTFLFTLYLGASKLVPHVYMVRCQPVATGSLLTPHEAWDHTQILKLVGRCPALLNHLASPAIL